MLRILVTALSMALILSACGGGSGGGGGSGTPTTSDAQIQSARILAGGNDGKAAVRESLIAAGFAVRYADGGSFEPSKPVQGQIFENWDAEVMAASVINGGAVSLSDLAEALALSFPELQSGELAIRILRDLRSAANSQNASKKFWAQLIVELGRKATFPYDLLDPTLDPAAVSFDAVQLGLILHRLAADIILIDGFTPTPIAITMGVSRVDFGARAAPAAADLPCTLTETESTILDGASATAGKAFDAFIEYLDKAGVAGAGTYAKRLAGANAILTYLKLIWSLAAFETKIEMDADELVRTHSSAAEGNPQKITATFKLNIKDVQVVNCMRVAFNAAGLDFSLWNDGPIKGAGVDWFLLEGATSGVQLGYLVFGENPLNHVSNNEGVDTVVITGRRQKVTLPANATRVDKPGKVHVKVNLKNANIVNDLFDALGGAISLPAEMAYRHGLGFGRSLSFNVVDWKDPCDANAQAQNAGRKATPAAPQPLTCAAGWAGTIKQVVHNDTPFGTTTITTNADVTFEFDAAATVTAQPGEQISKLRNGTFTYDMRFDSIGRNPPCRSIATGSGALPIAPYEPLVPAGTAAGLRIFPAESRFAASGASVVTITTTDNCNDSNVDVTVSGISYVFWLTDYVGVISVDGLSIRSVNTVPNVVSHEISLDQIPLAN
jgi:hypothetical protein